MIKQWMREKSATRFALALIALGMLCAPLVAHEFNCAQLSGIDSARCERHEKMFAKCGPIKGEAHFACDRELLLSHSPQCSALAGANVQRCGAEVAALTVCEPRPGSEFIRCGGERIKASPVGCIERSAAWSCVYTAKDLRSAYRPPALAALPQRAVGLVAHPTTRAHALQGVHRYV